MDADLSHDPAQLPSLVDAASNSDVVIGSRYVPGGRIVNWPMRRRLLSRFANVYVRMVTRLRVRDCTSGYRCWRRETLASMPLDRFISDGYSFLVEMLHAAARRRRRITEVPITFVERRLGESKLSRAGLVESAVAPWRLINAQQWRPCYVSCRSHEMTSPQPVDPRRDAHRDFYADKRVMITGGLGFIGSNLARHLAALGARVLVVDSLLPD